MKSPAVPGEKSRLTVTRLERNPIITAEHFGEKAGLEGYNINGPSLIRVPPWIENPPGKYYLYFGHHQGKYIRLAFADDPEGPYTLYDGGVLHVSEFMARISAEAKKPSKIHVASPDVHVMNDRKEIWMYFHANIKGKGEYSDQGQTSYLAISKGGIHFETVPEVLGPFYMRVFRHDGYFYAIAKNDNKDAILLRSVDGRSKFERGPTFEPHFRHCAVLKRGDILHVFYTRAFEMQESILHATMHLEGDWTGWRLSSPTLLLKPEKDWEGADLPPFKSRYGGAAFEMNALRDPCIFEDPDRNRVYLLYSVKGEKGIAIALLEGV